MLKIFLFLKQAKLWYTVIMIWFSMIFVILTDWDILLKIWRWDGKITQDSEFEENLCNTLIDEIDEGGYTLNELALLWLYCKAWGATVEYLFTYRYLWKCHRDNLRQVLFNLCFPDPDETPASNDLYELLKMKLTKDNTNLSDWSNKVYKASLDLVPKCE